MTPLMENISFIYVGNHNDEFQIDIWNISSVLDQLPD